MEIEAHPESESAPARPSWLVTGVSGGACVALGSICGFVVPTFAGMYSDLGQELPLITRVIVSIPGIGWAIGGAAMCLMLLQKNLYLSRRLCRALDVAVTIAAMIGSVFVMVPALFLPLIVTVKSAGR